MFVIFSGMFALVNGTYLGSKFYSFRVVVELNGIDMYIKIETCCK